ncbi:MAG: asparagine synthase (glutamine-hydrolyzing) [Omnitrophica bacterium RBG_13_46_9]|nr:MAG: asparagine synthase (glutamine-hydrolyzing) [Omnitrophica bacterium RBG_13_46_9]
MCGISGTIGFESSDLVGRMNQKMGHRGPDSTGIWRDDLVCLGHTRLSIIDISEAGRQPMSNEDGTLWITFNGEIYNFEVLRKDLEIRGHRFKSRTDTEVILHLYEERKEKCLDILRGMFAFAIWDKKENKLFAARDRFGIKPFFYFFKGDRFVFSSELRAMLVSGVPKREINTRALKNYFTYGSVEAPETLIKEVFQLLPAHYLIFQGNTLKIERYWKLNLSKARGPAETESEQISDIRGILDEAVRMRLVGDVPVGAFLSGGVDSSVITALMQKHSQRPVKTFSVIFEEKEYDERRFSRKIAKALKTDHTEILLKEKDILGEIPSIFDSMDQPSIDGFNTFIISKAVKKTYLKVALSGLGGDEIFAGYTSFRILPIAAFALKPMRIFPQRLRDKLFKLLRPLARLRCGLKLLFAVLKCTRLEDLYFLKRMVFLPDEVNQLLPEVRDKKTEDRTDADDVKHIDIVNQLSLLELKSYLQNMLLQDTDRMSMANSLEVRVPYLDHFLVEKMFKIPGKAKLGKDFPKRLLVKATKDLLPEEIQKRLKMGFVFPFERWLKGELRYYCEEKFSKDNLKNIAFLDSGKVNKIWVDFLRGSRLYNYSSILCLLSFINWYEKNILT